VVTLDACYPGVIEETRLAMKALFPAARVCQLRRMGGSCVALQIVKGHQESPLVAR
jgi:hypothetical protein